MNEAQNTNNIQGSTSATGPSFPLIKDTFKSVLNYIKENKARLIEIVKPFFITQVVLAFISIALISSLFFKLRSLGVFQEEVADALFNVFKGGFAQSGSVYLMLGGLILTIIVGTILQIILAISTKINLFEEYSGRKSSLKDNIKRFFTQFFPILWIGVIVALAGRGGSLLLAIPGIWFSTGATFSLYNFLDSSDVRGLSAVSKSFHLVKGYWWKNFFSIIAMSFIVFITAFVFVLLISAVLFAILFGLSSVMDGTMFSSVGAIIVFIVAIYLLILCVNLAAIFAMVFAERWKYVLYRSQISIKQSSEYASVEAVAKSDKYQKNIRIWTIVFMVFGVISLLLNSLTSGSDRNRRSSLDSARSASMYKSLMLETGKGSMTLEKMKEVIAKGNIKKEDMITDKFTEANGWAFSVSAPTIWDWDRDVSKEDNSIAIIYYPKVASEQVFQLVLTSEQLNKSIIAKEGIDINSTVGQNIIAKEYVLPNVMRNRSNVKVSRISDNIISASYNIDVPDKTKNIYGEFFIIFNGSEINYIIASAPSDVWDSVAPKIYSMVLSFTPDKSAQVTSPSVKNK